MLTVGTDAYVSLAEANAYFVARSNSTWAGTSEAAKEAAIIKATAYMDASYDWKGKIYNDLETNGVPVQPLGWPRKYVWDIQGRKIDNTIPKGVKDACCELAYLALGGDLVQMQLGVGRITSERVGQVAVTYDGNTTSDGYAYVNLLLRGLGSLRGGSQMIKLNRA
jgi:hypothetical protein